jgi:hypothetical protein
MPQFANGARADSVQLQVGGGFPFAWDLYDYSPAGTAWTRNFLGSGTGPQPFKLPQGTNYVGHVLTWSVAVVDQDSQSLLVSVVATLLDAGGQTLSQQQDDWTASKDHPQFFVSVGIKQ